MKAAARWQSGVVSLSLGIVMLNMATLRWIVGADGAKQVPLWGAPLPWLGGSPDPSASFDVAPAIWVLDFVLYGALLYPLMAWILAQMPDKGRIPLVAAVGTWALFVAAAWFLPGDVNFKAWLAPTPLAEVSVRVVPIHAVNYQFYVSDKAPAAAPSDKPDHAHEKH